MREQAREEQISLYLYGEMDEAERLRFEAEMAESPSLAAAVSSERELLALFDGRPAMKVSDAELTEARYELMRTVYRQERETAQSGVGGWWMSLMSMLSARRAVLQPVAATLLVVAGFWAGRTTHQSLSSGEETQTAEILTVASPAGFTDVHSVASDPSGGNVEIVVEERRTIRGNPADPRIRGLLISSVRSANSGLRLESMDALEPGRGDEDVRGTLIRAMLEDENPGVRLRALELLSGQDRSPDVRAALFEAVRRDENPGVRVLAIDLLTAHPDRDMVGGLQELVRTEQNNYVRMQCERALTALNASVESY